MKKQTKPKGEKKPEKPEVKAQNGRPYPVPPSGCGEGYYDNGSGLCVLDS